MPDPDEICNIFTVIGWEVAWSMLHGLKPVENRSIKYPAGWYALHVGRRPASHAEVMAAIAVEREALRLPAVMPNAMVGQIVGLVYLPGKSLQVEECQVYPWRHWAIGRICNLITHVVPLEPSS